MIRNRLDQFGKNVVRELLILAGDPQPEQEVPPGNAQRFDIWFVPDPAKQHHLKALGYIVTKLIEVPAAIELWSEQLRIREFHASMRKWYNWHHALELRDKRHRELPALWHICAKPSDEIFRKFLWEQVKSGPKPGPTGFYRKKDEGLPIYLVMIPELPVVRETLLLRLLGSPANRLVATRELQNLEPDAIEHQVAYEWLVRLRLDLKSENLTALEQAEQEFVMGVWLEERDRKLVESAVVKAKREMKREHAKTMVAFRLGRELTKAEQRFLSAQLRTKDFAQLLSVVLGMSSSELGKWLEAATRE